MGKRIGLIGASCRAMAASLVRGGFSVVAADMFADYDLGQIGEVRALRNYPWSARRWLRDTDVDAWCYTGGLENYPRLIERMAREKRLLGNSPETLRMVRDPFWLAGLAKRHGFEFPETHRIHDPAYNPIDPQPSDQWLLKPYRSAGGLNIERVSTLPKSAHRFYLQRKLSGVPMSAVVLSTMQGCQIVGVNRLHIGPQYGAPLPYLFAGAVSLCVPETNSLEPIVNAIHEEAGMIGLWGIDFLQTDRPTLLEVNPRWTATTALHERMRENPLMPRHVQACLQDEVKLSPRFAYWSSGVRIVYASKRLEFTDRMLRGIHAAFSLTEESYLTNQKIGDIPIPGTTIDVGSPVCTLYVDAKSEALAEEALRVNQELLEEIIYSEGSSSGDC
ncbi:ATP-grasp domain protein [Bremerella volcania]|uniref:ATP-grasp domain protein n=1 Tax=Bremerella volcania TaxID=2527984 RepID=A0A518CDS8_9BACT|nr:ATP-grasp domain-containing protein [Bremerella volcania]QDU77373.1 ATP-grasp domain protein [Bremerella volcania]